jgi:hypothetical protein
MVHAGAVNCPWPALVEAIAFVESGRRAAAVGDQGRARGMWQMHRAAWEDVSAVRRKGRAAVYPYAQAKDPHFARAYAEDYLKLIAAKLNNLYGRAPRAAEVYAAWNLGYTKFTKTYRADLGACPPAVIGACNRLEVLCRTIAGMRGNA